MKMPKKFGVAVCLLLLGLTSKGKAFADDFSGFYVGLNLGGASMAHANAATTTVGGGPDFEAGKYFRDSSVPAIAAAGAQKMDPRGYTGGGMGGYNFQKGNLVFGGEADFGAMTLNASKSTSAIYPCCAPTGFTVTQSVKTRWLLTGRGRAGLVHGGWMLFGSGGIAVTDLNYQAVFTDNNGAAHENGGVKSNRVGWTAGLGMERQVAPFTFRGEYLYADFGRVTTTSTNLTSVFGAFPGSVFTHTARVTTHILRGGLIFRF